SKLVYLSAPTSKNVGEWTANEFLVERRDDFDNATGEGTSNVVLNLGAGQSTLHSNESKPFYFTEPLDQSSQINNIQFNIGVSQLAFSYYDTMSATPIGEDGRS